MDVQKTVSIPLGSRTAFLPSITNMRTKNLKNCFRNFKRVLSQNIKSTWILINEKANVCALYRFESIITQAVDSFADSSEANWGLGWISVHDSFIALNIGGGVVGRKKYANSKTLPQDNAREKNRLLPTAATNLLRNCLNL